MTSLAYVLGGAWIFMLGATVGSFANVCIYRIALEKSVIWPASHCPRCVTAILPRDNIPILGWILLRGRCRNCGLPIAVRYPLIELLAGGLFVAVYLVDLVYGYRTMLEAEDLLRLGSHLVLVAFLLVATFIDYDYYILPDSITVTGMIAGLLIGTLAPQSRPAPVHAETAYDGFLVGMTGLLIGGAIIWAVRIVGGFLFRKEAMGFGDVTLMAMIGAFLGWPILPPTLFLAAILGLVHAAYKLARTIRKWILRRNITASDGEIPFGPYLSLAAYLLLLAWPWLWTGRLSMFYRSLGEGVRFLTTGRID